jgi:glyoxylase-like metal-dependent hydrolase (beta-lactamase superfamily II)
VTWEQVGERAYRKRYASVDLNIGVIRGADALCVIDTRATPREADELLDDLRDLAPLPVRWAVNTHGHWDHCFGNARFPPPIDLWGQEQIVPYLADQGEAMRRELIDEGHPLSADLAAVEIVPPRSLVRASHVLDLGDTAVTLSFQGRGHTDHDLVVVHDDVVFAGDLLEESAPPCYGPDSFPLEWPATVHHVVSGNVTLFVPGHGDVVTPAAARRQATDITRVADELRRWHAAGATIEDARREGSWPWPRDVLRHAVARAWEQLAEVR